MDYLKIYKTCYLIRTFEKTVEKLFEAGKMRGTTHGCIGQEIIPSIVMEYIDKEKDYITGTHRCHGQVLAYTEDPYRLACEMMGKADGFNSGMGGSQHIKIDRYITNGVTGGMAAVGAGMAFSMKKKESEGIVISFLGDGGFQEGYVSETMNMAAVYEIPIVYILENNRYAMSTLSSDYCAGSYEKRVRALEIQFYHCEAKNIDDVDVAVKQAIEYTKINKKPSFVQVDTFRLCGHSKSDDMAYMKEEEKRRNIEEDPLLALRKKIDQNLIGSIHSEIEYKISQAFELATNCGEMGIDEYKELVRNR